LFSSGEYSIIVSDFGGRVEELMLISSGGKLRNVLLNHKRNDTAIMENPWWKGMLLLPWANRIAKVRQANYYNIRSSYVQNIYF